MWPKKMLPKSLPVLREISADIAKIPLKNKIDKCPKVLIVGEIYVRRDDFAVDELIQHFSVAELSAKYRVFPNGFIIAILCVIMNSKKG